MTIDEEYLLENLKIKIFADEASPISARTLRKENPRVCGFTTNPALMARCVAGPSEFPSGIHYESYARRYLEAAQGLPVSFEVTAPRTGNEMEAQARRIASWGPNVYVKIPIIDVDGVSTGGLIDRLSHDGVKVNVTCVFTPHHAWTAIRALRNGAPSIISVFAGRIADTGRDPVGLINVIRKDVYRNNGEGIQVLWASTRQVRDVVLAAHAHCDIITLASPLLAKLHMLGHSLDGAALETVREFAVAGTRIQF